MGEVEELARRLYIAEQQIKNVKKPRLQFSSIDDGAIPEYDADGTLKSVIGQQFDGGHGVLVTSDPEPLQPSAPLVFAGPASLTARWDGVWCDADGNPDETIPVPTYHGRVEVHAGLTPDYLPITAATLRGTIETPRGGDVVISPLEGGPWYIKLVARSQSGNLGPASDGVFGEPAPLLDEAAVDTAVDAHLSASGLVQIVHNDVAPTMPPNGWAEGAVWFETSGPGDQGTTVSWHRWDGSAWIEQPKFDEAFMPLINIGSGTFGDLAGSRIQARTIQSTHIEIGGVTPQNLGFGIDNLILNPSSESPDLRAEYPQGFPLDQYAPGFFAHIEQPGHAHSGTHSIKLDTANTPQWYPSFYPTSYIQCKPGDKFHIQFWAKRYACTVGVGFQMVAFGADGSPHPLADTLNGESAVFVQGYPRAPFDAANETWVSYEAVQTVPADAFAVSFRLVLLTNGDVAHTGYWALDDLEVRRVMASTSTGGQVMELSPQGLRLFGIDGSEVVSLTSTPPNYFGILDGAGNTLSSFSDDGTISGKSLNVESDPVLMGQELIGSYATFDHPSEFATSWLDQLPRGIVARGNRIDMANYTVENGERAIFELEYFEEANRTYRITLEPFGLDWDTNNALCELRLRSTTGSSRPNLGSPVLRGWAMRGRLDDILWPGGSFFHLSGSTSMTRRLLLSINTPGVLRIVGSYEQPGIGVEDCGPRLVNTGIPRSNSTELGFEDPEPTPPPEKKNYTKTYSATGYRSYFQSSGSHYNFNTSKMFQGNSPSVGGLQSIATFPSMTSDLSGASISSIRAYFYFEHWYYNSGGDAKIGVHGATSLPSTFPGSYQHAITSTGWPKPGGRWVNIPVAFWDGFKSGAYRGLTLGDTSPSTVEYGYARGSATKIEIKYSK